MSGARPLCGRCTAEGAIRTGHRVAIRVASALVVRRDDDGHRIHVTCHGERETILADGLREESEVEALVAFSNERKR